MPVALPVIAAVGAAAAVVGTVQQGRQAKKAQKAQERQQEVASRRERMQAIRAAQMQRASAMMSAIGAGSSDSSGAAGGIGSISSQLGTELSFGNQMTGLSKEISGASGKASMWGGIAGLGMTAFNSAGGFGAFGQDVQQPSFQSADPGPSSTFGMRPRRNPIYG